MRGNLESGIQAGNTLSVSSGGQILNTGNLMGGTEHAPARHMLLSHNPEDQRVPVF
ncbi:hypothetical protein [Cupriavidus laharis]|uniref:hypothetical protein n=1 Tax=Cupriavidus laharis TaxID=151654 RepID=UPI001CC6BE3A|nr:hypothetical protein [Cupriavidus laharis]